jgi:hypothetical protein
MTGIRLQNFQGNLLEPKMIVTGFNCPQSARPSPIFEQAKPIMAARPLQIIWLSALIEHQIAALVRNIFLAFP